MLCPSPEALLRPALRAAFLLACLVACFVGGPAAADRVHVAAAANFAATAEVLARDFEARSGHEVILSTGATGLLYAQIVQGAPFDVYLAADRARPARAVAEGYGVAGSAFTYATGRLALWSAAPGRVTGPRALDAPGAGRVAIANPATAPYGAAALQALAALGRAETVRSRLVRGTSVAQAYQFAATGAADLAFVAASQIAARPGGSHWPVPQALHSPIRQDAVLIGAGSPPARAFLAYLAGPDAASRIAAAGYGLGHRPPPSGGVRGAAETAATAAR